MLRENDPVIFTKNNYDLGVFNGTTGRVDAISLDSGRRLATIRLEYTNVVVNLSDDDLFETGAQLAYAISVHKSQGSEYEKVIFCCATSGSLVERSLVCTGVTRAKNLCILVGSQLSYSTAVKALPRADKIFCGDKLS